MQQIFYVIGASGAGKDALMQAARVALSGRSIVFAHRYVTRPVVELSENFVSLTDDEFAVRSRAGCFWWQWQSHGLHYGIGVEVLHWLRSGLVVVINGSRAYLAEAQQRCDEQGVQLTPIWVHCDTSVLRQRLLARGRETPAEVEARLQRASAFEPPEGVRVIDNSTSLSAALAQWMPLLDEALHD